jgi:hypothetical protein
MAKTDIIDEPQIEIGLVRDAGSSHAGIHGLTDLFNYASQFAAKRQNDRASRLYVLHYFKSRERLKCEVMLGFLDIVCRSASHMRLTETTWCSWPSLPRQGLLRSLERFDQLRIIVLRSIHALVEGPGDHEVVGVGGEGFPGFFGGAAEPRSSVGFV